VSVSVWVPSLPASCLSSLRVCRSCAWIQRYVLACQLAQIGRSCVFMRATLRQRESPGVCGEGRSELTDLLRLSFSVGCVEVELVGWSGGELV
jgi:hypothetical protein